jgi:hypothetical protein
MLEGVMSGKMGPLSQLGPEVLMRTVVPMNAYVCMATILYVEAGLEKTGWGKGTA